MNKQIPCFKASKLPHIGSELKHDETASNQVLKGTTHGNLQAHAYTLENPKSEPLSRILTFQQ